MTLPGVHIGLVLLVAVGCASGRRTSQAHQNVPTCRSGRALVVTNHSGRSLVIVWVPDATSQLARRLGTAGPGTTYFAIPNDRGSARFAEGQEVPDYRSVTFDYRSCDQSPNDSTGL